MRKHQKPPLGIKPEFVHREQRLRNLAAAINRHVQFGFIGGGYAVTIRTWCRELSDRLDEYVIIRKKEVKMMPTDKERLDFLQELTNEHRYTGKVVGRRSSTGRGWRLHETSQVNAVLSVRAAIDNFMVKEGFVSQEEKIPEQANKVGQPFKERLSLKVGMFLGILSSHISAAGGMDHPEVLEKMSLGDLLDICFRNGITITVKSKHSNGKYEPIIDSSFKKDSWDV